MTPETVERRERLLLILEGAAQLSDPWMTTNEILELTGMRHTEVYPNLLALAKAGKLIHWPAHRFCPIEGDDAHAAAVARALLHGTDNNARWRHALVFEPAPVHDVDLLEEWLAS